MVADLSERPSARWRRSVEQQRVRVAAGELAADKAYAAQLWPAGFIAAIDAVLAVYEQEVAGWGGSPTSGSPTDEQVWAAVERAVVGLNDADDGHIETGEREDLAEYLDRVLTGAGVDVEALTAGRGLERGELTDQWRDW
ncbi:hypothetical protein FB565_007993 [Actinoplanes lutulentus]|uniref:Uncharacterized protein n=1 Tax=Actinoplanes lutulentus TaxID=1287878 RepID=A0A327Z4P8_9ACTN|nr:hypothetical protein [Actinoplanes lutulentus]MBB2948210.1 hypothetical protein [Actinoplanes lutulentus]RAK31291.1 hypothetical protein B0I29_11597 [Actinoplanes lutulentus]